MIVVARPDDDCPQAAGRRRLESDRYEGKRFNGPNDIVIKSNGATDADNRGLYITACTHLFKIRLNQPGVRPGRRSGR